MQRWHPDTHPNTYFDGKPDPAHPHGCMIVTGGMLDGVPFASAAEAQAAYDKAVGFNQTKNQLHEHIRLNVDKSLLKPQLDDDGDPVIGADGKPMMVLKTKHPIYTTCDYRLGLVAASIGGLEESAARDAVHAALHDTLESFHRDNEFAATAIARGAVDPAKTLVATVAKAKQHHKDHLAKAGLKPLVN